MAGFRPIGNLRFLTQPWQYLILGTHHHRVSGIVPVHMHQRMIAQSFHESDTTRDAVRPLIVQAQHLGP